MKFNKQKVSALIASKQKKFYFLFLFLVIAAIGILIFSSSSNEKEEKEKSPSKNQSTFDLVSKNVKGETIRLSKLEDTSDVLITRLQSLEKALLDLREEKDLLKKENTVLSEETEALKHQVVHLEQKEAKDTSFESNSSPSLKDLSEETHLRSWEADSKKEDRNVFFEIPAGTVVKALLVSGVDCSVAVQKPTGPNMVLLRPLANGKLPRNVQVLLKGSVIIGNAIGDLAAERAYIRGERITLLIDKKGSFVETEISAYISGEDGREGMRGIVVDRSGSIITRAAFASFLQGVGQGIQATLNNQTIEKLARVSSEQSILNLDMFRNSAFQGGSTALSKLSDYYIKRAEQLQPVIQIAAGRIVDIVFTKTVKIGEKDLKKKLDYERAQRRHHA